MAGINISELKSTAQKPSRKEPSKKGLLDREITLFGGGLTDKKKEAFHGEMAVLMEAGVDIRSALEIIENEQPKQKDKSLFESLRKQVIDGKSFSEAIQQSKQFSAYEYHSIRIGEETGKLPRVQKELASYFQKKVKQRRQLVSALSYPVFILMVSVGAVLFMLSFVVPMFADVFKRFGGELPAITQMVIDASNFVSDQFLTLFSATILFIGSIFLVRKKTWFRKWTATILLKLPFVGPLAQQIYLAQFSTIMALMVSSKIPLMQAIGLARQMISLYPLGEAMEQIENDILQGTNLNVSMANFSIFTPRMVSLIKVGEEVGQLDLFFEKIAEQYAEEVEHQTGLIGTLIEPAMLVFLGGVVGTILVSMYLPLFQLSTSFG